MSQSRPQLSSPATGDSAPLITKEAFASPRLAWSHFKNFCGLDGEATYLWPRWLFLRAVGGVFFLIFLGILHEGSALVGPSGLAPLAGFFTQLTQAVPSGAAAFLQAPSLFWLSPSAGMITLVTWIGLTSAVALVLNLWPRGALFSCWACLLSFVATWRVFSGTQLDQFMLETALLSIPFAPRGFRPGLGAQSPPRPIAVFMMRWLLFRVMFESGLLKLLAGDVRWWDLTAMDVLYETAPFPTILGFLDHQLPHAYHVAELALTFIAELVGPLLAVFAGRRGRWFALIAWIMLQVGIQLTNNFGWLNVGSIALGLLLLDDQMLASLARRCGFAKLHTRFAAAASPRPVFSRGNAWSRYALRGALSLHFGLTLIVFFYTWRGAATDTPIEFPAPVEVANNFRSVNTYTLYANFLPYRFAVEFEGSNDGGETWRTYNYRYQPQRPDQISPFIAPWYPRFEATLQVQANSAEPSPVFKAVATHLLARSPAGLSLFRDDPFSDRPATMLRIRGYRLSFVDLPTHRATGQYWRKQSDGDYLPMIYVTEQGAIASASSEIDVIRAHALHGNRNAQNKLGTLYAFGEGVPADHAEAARWFRLAAAQGHPLSQFFLGLSYAQGDGVPRNLAEAARYYRLSADQGYAPAQTNLGFMHARGEGLPADETEALVWFNLAARSGNPDALKLQASFARRLNAERVALAQQRSELLATEIAARLRAK